MLAGNSKRLCKSKNLSIYLSIYLSVHLIFYEMNDYLYFRSSITLCVYHLVYVFFLICPFWIYKQISIYQLVCWYFRSTIIPSVYHLICAFVYLPILPHPRHFKSTRKLSIYLFINPSISRCFRSFITPNVWNLVGPFVYLPILHHPRHFKINHLLSLSLSLSLIIFLLFFLLAIELRLAFSAWQFMLFSKKKKKKT